MNQLIAIENLKPIEIYSPEKVDSILKKISEEVKAYQPDLSTAHGRKEIASLAYKIAQSKTFMDDCGKKLGEDAKKTLDTINAERKKIRDTLDTLKEEVRRPLTEWENKEEKRIAHHKQRLIEIEKLGHTVANNWMLKSAAEIQESLNLITNTKDFDWEEFKEESNAVINVAEAKINASLESKKLHDEQQEELKKLRAEKEQREKLEAERLEKERAEAKALAEAEEKKKAEDRAKQEEAYRESKRIEREKQLAFEKEQAIAHEKEMADKRVKESEERAIKEKQDAIDQERRRVELLNKNELEAEQRRQANIKHRTKVNNEILKALTTQGVDEETGKKIIVAIVSGLIPHTKIGY